MHRMDNATDPVSNILAVYNGTDSRLPNRSAREHAALRAEGVRWYRDNRKMIRRVSDDSGLSRSAVAAVFAAYSVNTTWAGNLTVAMRAITDHAAGRPVRGLAVHIRLATIAMDTDSGDSAISTIGSNARKVRAFYGAFMARRGTLPVIDRHAHDIATGSHTVPNGKAYYRVAEYYVQAARVAGVRPEEMQAATWTIWRGSAG